MSQNGCTDRPQQRDVGGDREAEPRNNSHGAAPGTRELLPFPVPSSPYDPTSQ
jgi:hypothetical protein